MTVIKKRLILNDSKTFNKYSYEAILFSEAEFNIIVIKEFDNSEFLSISEVIGVLCMNAYQMFGHPRPVVFLEYLSAQEINQLVFELTEEDHFYVGFNQLYGPGFKEPERIPVQDSDMVKGLTL